MPIASIRTIIEFTHAERTPETYNADHALLEEHIRRFSAPITSHYDQAFAIMIPAGPTFTWHETVRTEAGAPAPEVSNGE